MSEQDPKGPPKLDRVPAGYRPPPVARPAAPAAPPEGKAPGASHGLAAREVGADAAIAAGLAHEGSLATDGSLRLFYLAAATQATGRLTLSTDARRHALTFKRGVVEHAASSDPAEDLGRHLVRRGALTPEQLVAAEGARAAAGGDLAAALLAQRLVAPAEVATLLQEHGAALVARALAVESGTWRWEPGVAPPPSSFSLGSPWGQLCAAVRSFDAATVQRRLGDREHRAASRVGGRVRPEDLRLNPQETRVATVFDGVRSPSEIARAQPAEAATVLRLALLLGETELLAFGAPRKAPPPAQAAPPPQAAPPAAPRAASGAPQASAPKPAPSVPPAAAQRAPAAAPPTAPARPPAAPAPRPPQAAAPRPPPATPPAATPPPRPPPLQLEALRERFARLDDQDHFEVLGVRREATAAQIKIAYFQLAKTFHPDAVPVDAAAELKKLCADIFSRIGEAWSVLGEDASRVEYLEALRTGGTAEVDVLNILRAEDTFQTGTLLLKARRYDEAAKAFDEAIAMNAEEAEFGIWRAWCDFLMAQDKRSRQAAAAAAIEAGLKRNPKCAPGYLFLGQMSKICGDLGAAERHLRRGLAVAPDHADLQRELKYLRK